MKVYLLPAAEEDLEAIVDFIARDNPRRAISFSAELRGKVNGLSTMAESFPFARLPRNPNLRRRVHGNYCIFYSLDFSASRVDVERIVHSSQDVERLFNE